MAGISLSDAETQLALWLAAEQKVAEGQAYTINGRSLTRANLREIGDRIDFWDNKVKKLSRGGMRIQRAVPIDS